MQYNDSGSVQYFNEIVLSGAAIAPRARSIHRGMGKTGARLNMVLVAHSL